MRENARWPFDTQNPKLPTRMIEERGIYIHPYHAAKEKYWIEVRNIRDVTSGLAVEVSPAISVLLRPALVDNC
jgi:hypothetical protein